VSTWGYDASPGGIVSALKCGNLILRIAGNQAIRRKREIKGKGKAIQNFDKTTTSPQHVLIPLIEVPL